MSSPMTVEKHSDIRKSNTGSKNFQTFQLFPDLEKDFSCKSSMSTHAKYFPARKAGAARGGVGSPGRAVSGGGAQQVPQVGPKGGPTGPRRHRVPRIPTPPACTEGFCRPSAGWRKRGNEWEGTRGTTTAETSKSAHRLHTQRHTVALETKSITQALVGEVGTHSFGENQDWGQGVLSRARPGPRSPRRLPSKGAAQRRDWWSRRRNMS